MGLEVTSATHHVIVCLSCARDAQLCTGHADALRAYRRATRGFRVAGWALVPNPDVHPHHGPYADYPWRCPPCIAAGATSKGPHTARWGQGRLASPSPHTQAVCDACGRASAEICGKRDELEVARANAVAVFESQYWRCDPGRRGREARWPGDGRWYCPACASVPHM